MTRKDYVATAAILNVFLKTYNSESRPDLVDTFETTLVEPFIDMFQQDNERFDSDRFWEACFKD